MLETALQMYEAAIAWLLDRKPIEIDLRELDNTINDREQDIRGAILKHISVDPYTDTAFSLMLMSIVQDAERIGDLAKSIDKAASLAQAPLKSSHAEMLRPITDAVAALFDKTTGAFVDGDPDLAREVMDANDAVKMQTTDFIHSLAGEVHITVNEAVILGMCARMIGRVGSHLSNIASSVALPFDQVRRAPTWPAPLEDKEE